MFQPIPKTLIPTLIKARVPVWLLVGALAAQYAINSASQPIEPNCRMNVQRVHQSTYSLEFKNLSEAKLKISTLCDVPYVLIENLTVPCNGKGQAEYLGQAFGQIYLKDNRIVPVSGKSDKPILLICRISAK